MSSRDRRNEKRRREKKTRAWKMCIELADNFSTLSMPVYLSSRGRLRYVLNARKYPRWMIVKFRLFYLRTFFSLPLLCDHLLLRWWICAITFRRASAVRHERPSRREFEIIILNTNEITVEKKTPSAYISRIGNVLHIPLKNENI